MTRLDKSALSAGVKACLVVVPAVDAMGVLSCLDSPELCAVLEEELALDNCRAALLVMRPLWTVSVLAEWRTPLPSAFDESR